MTLQEACTLLSDAASTADVSAWEGALIYRPTGEASVISDCARAWSKDHAGASAEEAFVAGYRLCIAQFAGMENPEKET